MIKVKLSAIDRLKRQAEKEGDLFLRIFLHSLASSVVKKEECWIFCDYPKEVFVKLIQNKDLDLTEVEFLEECHEGV